MLLVAEVIETDLAFKRSVESQFISRGSFPLGTVRVRTVSQTGPYNEYYASPAWNITYMPMIGEHILLFRMNGSNADSVTKSYNYFYLGPISIQDNVNLNPLPNQVTSTNTTSYTVSAVPRTSNNNTYTPGKNFRENPNVKTLQPYEGDIIFHGRHGQAIRFSSTITGDTSQYTVSPFWSGRNNSPITVISNGHKPESGPNRYVIEDPNTTKSMIILSTDQSIKFDTAHPTLGKGVPVLANYNKAQVIISSDRLIFNSSTDEVIISGKTTVNVITPKWQMDMDKLFTLLEQTLQQLADLTSGKAQFQTPMGGPTLSASNVTQVQKLLTELKTMKQ
jgi:hypothetical protein